MEGEEGDFGSLPQTAQINLPPYGPGTVPLQGDRRSEEIQNREAEIAKIEAQIQTLKDFQQLLPIIWDLYEQLNRAREQDPIEPRRDPDPFPFLARLEEEEPDNLGKTKEEEIAVAIADVTIDQDEGGEGDT